MTARTTLAVAPAQAGAQPGSRKDAFGLDASLRWHDEVLV